MKSIGVYWFFKRLFFKCSHNWVYLGIEGGMGFRWRVIKCDKCMKEQTSVTCRGSINDNYTSGQKLTKKDFEYFDGEIK